MIWKTQERFVFIGKPWWCISVLRSYVSFAKHVSVSASLLFQSLVGLELSMKQTLNEITFDS